jgi:hypothetical protein
VDVNVKDNRGRTALIIVTHGGSHERIVGDSLMHQRLEVHAKDWNGRRALFWANCGGYIDTIRKFLKFDKLHACGRFPRQRTSDVGVPSGRV